MPHMIATKDFTYAHGALRLRPGDMFFAESDEDARMLKGWGKAKDVQAGASVAYHRKDEVAEEAPAPRTKRKYQRRDISYWAK